MVAGKLVSQQTAVEAQQRTVAALERSLAAERARLATLEGMAAETTAVIRALETSIRLGHPGAEQLHLKPVKQHTRYGARGSLIGFLLEATTAAGPEGITTRQLVNRAAEAFGLPVATSKERQAMRLTVRSRMRELRDLHGAVVGELRPVGKRSETIWRLSSLPTLDALRLDAAKWSVATTSARHERAENAHLAGGEVAGQRACGPGGRDGED